ncbi:MAG TPA: ethanolamine ammonia-lyase subunit EutB, partial [Planctomycetota bacterium]|nr:ethanolamine ammonia-lyase subunit EutB [Planctomycetota bacterium]
MRLSLRVDGRSFRFRDLNDLLAKANRERSGDRLAGLAARSAQERVAARRLLAEVTLAELRARPALPPEHDAVSRVVEEGLDETVYRRVRGLTAGELRDHVLGAAPSELTAERLGDGLTPEMAAAVAKLCSNLDLVAGAARIPVVTRANTTLGLPGRLGVRLQPNHPTDDVAEILAQTAEGLAWGCGDAVIGVNPARDDEEVVRRLLLALDGLVRKHRVPTQTCVLAHVTTQMRVLDGGGRGARRGGSEQVPMGLMFQSLAGTQSACRAFGIDVALLDEAAAMARDRCNVKGPHVMYFETGQGSELSSGCHEGIDQVTLEARCYGLARRYAPFLVNTVVGFIGPEYLYDASEVQRAGLEDHFMGKLLGLPMGVDACATNHMRGDHDDLENQALLLAAAGANYVMGVPMGDDVLLGYRSTSFHDAAALRETLGRRPAPEFERWMEGQGLMRNGRLTARAGDGRRFGLPARRRTRFLARIAVGR